MCFGTLSGSACQSNGYDNWGNILYQTDARGGQNNFIYDGLNRLLGVSYTNVPGSLSAMPNVCATSGSTNNAKVCWVTRTGRPTISVVQMAVIKEVDQFIGEPDEMSLRREFGFPEMMDTNIRAIINNLRRYKRTGVKLHHPILSGETLIDNRFAKGHIQRKGGGFQMDVDDATVYFIMLSKDYVSSKARLLKMLNSAELPSVILDRLDLDRYIEKIKIGAA